MDIVTEPSGAGDANSSRRANYDAAIDGVRDSAEVTMQGPALDLASVRAREPGQVL